MATKTIDVGYLARVEGEGSLHVLIEDDVVSDVQFKIFEPPRFFEAFLEGRKYTEAPDITARICGICPVAYQMSASHAMEMACGVTVGGQLRALRRLIYCGEWIESHALHVFMLHLPDFLGYEDAIQLARERADLVKMGLQLKKTGNDLMALVGGREIHPVNLRLGGFYRTPTRTELASFAPRLEAAREMALQTVAIAGGLDFPTFDQDYEFVALRHPDEYPFNEGRLVSNKGLDIDIREFNVHISEIHVARSNALQSTMRARGNYFVGPMARYSLNFDRLTPAAQEAALRAGLEETCTNPFKSIVVRAVELLNAVEEALRIIEAYDRPDAPYVPVEPRAGEGHGCTEAPRGICYHRYVIDEEGIIQEAQIAPPTAQNQLTMESDLRNFIAPRIHLPHEQLQWKCEQAIRNYDPCISCATHFLDLTVDRRPPIADS